MITFLLDVNLQQDPSLDLLGSWRVVDRTLNCEDPTTHLAQVTQVHLQPDSLQLEAPQHLVTGKWQVERSVNPSRPYLRLHLAQGSAYALITRLRYTMGGSYRIMSLHFHSGLELLLAQS